MVLILSKTKVAKAAVGKTQEKRVDDFETTKQQPNKCSLPLIYLSVIEKSCISLTCY